MYKRPPLRGFFPEYECQFYKKCYLCETILTENLSAVFAVALSLLPGTEKSVLAATALVHVVLVLPTNLKKLPGAFQITFWELNGKIYASL